MLNPNKQFDPLTKASYDAEVYRRKLESYDAALTAALGKYRGDEPDPLAAVARIVGTHESFQERIEELHREIIRLRSNSTCETPSNR